MKRIAFFLVGVLALAACTHDTPEKVDLRKYNSNTVKSGGFNVLWESDTDFDQVVVNTYDFQDAVPETKATYTNLVNLATGVLSSAVSKKVHQVVGTYTSVDIHGDPITVSGKIFYPKDGEIKNYIIASHYTIGSNAECPSESYSFEGIYAAKGYVVIVADYIGFGITSGDVHPYLQAETCARNVLDMAVVARPFLVERGIVPKDDKVILVGYSQGGACTMHVQRLIETSKDYSGKFVIKKNYCGAGPYDIAKTYDYAVKRDKTGIPCAIPMIIQGMSIGMDVPLDMAYFFKEPLLSHYKDWLNSKKYTVSQISALIGSDKLSDILTENGRDRKKDETARFYKELRENSIKSTYVPKAPIFMFHSEDDQTVPFVNSQIIQRQIRNTVKVDSKYTPDVEYDFGHYGNHQQGATKFFLKVLEKLD